MDPKWVSVYLSVIAIGVAIVLKLLDVGDRAQKLFLGGGVFLILLGAGLFAHDYLTVDASGPGSSKETPSVTQEGNQGTSNIITGSHNTIYQGMAPSEKPAVANQDKPAPQNSPVENEVKQVEPQTPTQDRPRSESGATKDDAGINIHQEDVTNSPNIIFRDNSRMIINADQARRITKKEEFIRALRAVGPVAVKLEEVNDRDAVSLYGQLYDLFIASEWTADERAQIHGRSWSGVHVAVQDRNAVPPGAIEVVKQLRANGIESGLVLEPNPAAFEKVAFIVRVGYRPQNNNE